MAHIADFRNMAAAHLDGAATHTGDNKLNEEIQPWFIAVAGSDSGNMQVIGHGCGEAPRHGSAIRFMDKESRDEFFEERFPADYAKYIDQEVQEKRGCIDAEHGAINIAKAHAYKYMDAMLYLHCNVPVDELHYLREYTASAFTNTMPSDYLLAANQILDQARAGVASETDRVFRKSNL